MIQALVTYPIVALAAAWVLWSMVLPVRLRAALRRGLGSRTVVCDVQGQAGGCGGSDCLDCPLAPLERRAARTAPLTLRLHP
jgi:hypothetical protein